MSTLQRLYTQCKQDFAQAGLDSPEFDAMTLLLHVFGVTRSGLVSHGNKPTDPIQEQLFLDLATQRLAHRPLQYILGEWEFMGLTLRVGEGVLIPRDDTVTAVHALSQRLQGNPRPKGLDLCAGSGAIALGICTLFPAARVYCVELSDKAFPYLTENLASYSEYAITARKGDILLPQTALAFPPASLDFIASNPPYIASHQVPQLQEEVLHEPVMALDGGGDGLRFYRAIAQHWLPLLKPGGTIVVEIGEDQGEAVTALFAAAGIQNLQIHHDLSNLPRCIGGQAPIPPSGGASSHSLLRRGLKEA